MRCTCHGCGEVVNSKDVISDCGAYGTYLYCVKCYAKAKATSGFLDKFDEVKYKKILKELE